MNPWSVVCMFLMLLLIWWNLFWANLKLNRIIERLDTGIELIIPDEDETTDIEKSSFKKKGVWI